MIILQNYKFLVKWLGAGPSRRNNVRKNLNAYGYMVAVVLNFSMTAVYLSSNINDIKEAFDPFMSLAGNIMTFTIIFHFLLNSDGFNALEKDLQTIVDDSKWEINSEMNSFIVWTFSFAFNPTRKKHDLCRFGATIFVLFVNFHVGILRYEYRCYISIRKRHIRLVHGKVYNELMDFCFNILVVKSVTQWIKWIQFNSISRRLPFDINTTVRCIAMASFQFYILIYVIFLLQMILSLFFGIIIYTDAILDDIKSMLNRIDCHSKSKHKTNDIDPLQQWIEAIELHARLNRYFVLDPIEIYLNTVSFTYWNTFWEY